MLGALACGFGAEVAVARGVEDVGLQQMLAWLLRRPPRAPDHPTLVRSCTGKGLGSRGFRVGDHKAIWGTRMEPC